MKNLPVRVSYDGLLPYKKYDTDAGLDLLATEDFEIRPHGSYILDTGVGFKIPDGYFGLVTQRSSIGFNRNCILSLGIIDSSYVGNIKLKIFNLGHDKEVFQHGDRIAQMVVIPHETLALKVVPTLLETERGENGIGSTGK